MIKKLPKSVEADLNKNATFNMFGLVNISALRSRTQTRLSSEELIKRIDNRFAKEMANSKIEYIGVK